MHDSNMRLQTDNFNLHGSVLVVGLVAITVLAVEVLGHGLRPQVNAPAQLNELLLLNASFKNSELKFENIY